MGFGNGKGRKRNVMWFWESLKEGIATLDWEQNAGVKLGEDLDINKLC